jgi:ubiquinone biosynthesis UbiH/UbiF/VisC/COQ6 family hydroxylase
METETIAADVLIVGAGPAGLALACALADAGLQVQLLEQAPRTSLDAPAEDGREIAITHRARRIMEALGLWARLPAEEIAPLREARVLDGEAPQALHFEADAGAEALGWLVPNHRIREAALAAALARPGVRLLCDARVTALQLAAEAAGVTLADGRRYAAPLVVAADSRLSNTRKLAGIGASMHDFGRSVVVGRIAHEREHDGIAWECFRYGNTLALLPMTGRRSSAVVTLPSDRVPEWMALADDAFAARIESQAQGRLGAVHAAGPRHLYPLLGVYARHFVAPRFALIGDAAVGMHPVTAHGWNFGLYGVEVLARELRAARGAGRDVGAVEVLARYESEHRRTTLPVYLATNSLVTLFTDERALPKLARRAVLDLAERVPPVSLVVKALMKRQLTGAGSGFALPKLPPLPPLPRPPWR